MVQLNEVLAEAPQQKRRRRAVRDTSVGPLSHAFGSAGGLFVALALAAAIPILLFGGGVAYIIADQQRSAAREAVGQTVDRVAERLETEILQEVQIAQALAVTNSLDEPDLERFYRLAERIASARPLWATVKLAEPSGTQLMNLSRPYGAQLNPIIDQESFQKALKTRTPVVGGIGPRDPDSGKRLVSVRVPVIRNGELKSILTIGLVPDQISMALREAGPPAGWSGEVLDAKGNIVAQTAFDEDEVGKPESASILQQLRRAGSGSYRSETDRGVAVETAYRTLSSIGGWSVYFQIPVRDLDGPVTRSVAFLLIGGFASIALAVALGLFVAREINQRRLLEAARSAGRLKASEERGALSIEAAELGTWLWDFQTGEVTGSPRFRDLCRLPDVGIDQLRWSEADLLRAIHPGDRDRFRAAVGRSVEQGKPLDEEFRLLDPSGKESWVRAAGNLERGTGGEAVYGVVADINLQKRSEAERSDLQRQLAAAQEAEQRRIARELHDQVGQTVTGLSLGLKTLEKNPALLSATAVREQLEWLRELATQIGRDIHRAASDLKLTALDDLGLYQALSAFLAEWTNRYGVEVDFRILGSDARLPSEVEAVLYWVVREALTNVLKHANAKNVGIIVERQSQQLVVLIEDDGAGFDLGDAEARLVPGVSGLGLSGIKERLAQIGGSFRLDSEVGAGTTLFIRVPIPSVEVAA